MTQQRLDDGRDEAVRALTRLYAAEGEAVRFEIQHLAESDGSVVAYAFDEQGVTLGSEVLLDPDDGQDDERVDAWVEDVWRLAGGPQQPAPTHATRDPGDPGHDLSGGSRR